MRKVYLMHKKSMFISLGILLFIAALFVVSHKVNEFSRKVVSVENKEVAKGSEDEKNTGTSKVTISKVDGNTNICKLYSATMGSYEEISSAGIDLYGVTAFTASCVDSSYTGDKSSKKAYCLDGARPPATGKYKYTNTTYSSIEGKLEYIATNNVSDTVAGASIRYLSYKLGVGDICTNYDYKKDPGHRRICYFFQYLDNFFGKSNVPFGLTATGAVSFDSSNAASYVTLEHSSEIQQVVNYSGSATKMAQEEKAASKVNFKKGNTYDYTSEGCNDLTCKGTITLKDVLKGGDYKVKAGEVKEKIEGLKVTAETKGDDILIHLEFKNCKDLSNKEITIPFTIEGLLSYTVLIPEGGNNNQQRLIMVDDKAKTYDIGFKFPSLDCGNCITYLKSTKTGAAITSVAGKFSAAKNNSGSEPTLDEVNTINTALQEESNQLYIISKDEKDEKKNCCEEFKVNFIDGKSEKESYGYQQIYNKLCGSEECKIYLKDTNVVKALKEINKKPESEIEAFRTTFEEGSGNKYTLVPESEEENTELTNCCSELDKKKYDKVYSTLCENKYAETCEEVFEKIEYTDIESEGCPAKSRGYTQKGIGHVVGIAYWEVHKANGDCKIASSDSYFASKADYLNDANYVVNGKNIVSKVEEFTSKDGTKHFTLGKKDGYEDCCELMLDQFTKGGTRDFGSDQEAEVYELLCGNPGCYTVYRQPEIKESVHKLMRSGGDVAFSKESIEQFHKTKELVEAYNGEAYDDDKIYTLGKPSDGNKERVDCCEGFASINWNYSFYCKNSCMIALEDEKVSEAVKGVDKKDHKTFENAQDVLYEWVSEDGDGEEKYTFFELGEAPEDKTDAEDCCLSVINDNNIDGSIRDAFKSYCEGSCDTIITGLTDMINNITTEDDVADLKAEVEKESNDKKTIGKESGKDDCCKSALNVATGKAKEALESVCNGEKKTCKDLVNSFIDTKGALANATQNEITSWFNTETTGLFRIEDLGNGNKGLPPAKNGKENCCDDLQGIDATIYENLCGENKLCEDGECSFKAECHNVGFQLACDPAYFGTVELYKVWEARNDYDNAKYGGDKISECVTIVSYVEGNDRRKTEWIETLDNLNELNKKTYDEVGKLTDVTGENNYLLTKAGADEELMLNNPYCRISCYERWDYQFAAFENFTGQEHAIKAGSYFAMDKDLWIKGERTCVTTYIDYVAYYTQIRALANRLVVNWNILVEFTDALNDASNRWSKYGYAEPEGETNPTKESQTVGICKESDLSYDDKYYVEPWTDSNGTYHEGYWLYHYSCIDDEQICKQYKIHTGKKGQDDVLEHKDKMKKLLNDQKTGKDGEKYGHNDKAESDPKKAGSINNTPERNISVLEAISVRNAAFWGWTRSETNPKPKWECSSRPEGQPEWTETGENSAFKHMLEEFFEYRSSSQAYTQSNGYIDLQKPLEDDNRKYGDDINHGPILTVIGEAKKRIDEIKELMDKKIKYMTFCTTFFLWNDEEEKREVGTDKVDNYNYTNKTTNDITGSYVKMVGLDATTPVESYSSEKECKGCSGTTGEVFDRKNDGKISSLYNPVGTYMYDEIEFMTQIGQRNYLIDNVNKNDELYKAGHPQSGTDGNYGQKFNSYAEGNGGQPIYYNKINTRAYRVEDPWSEGSIYAARYANKETETDPALAWGSDYPESGKVVKTFDEDDEGVTHIGLDYSDSSTLVAQDKFMTMCNAVDFETDKAAEIAKNPGQKYWPKNDSKFICAEDITFYYYRANYISQSLTNSSYFVNYGNFYYYSGGLYTQFSRNLDTVSSEPGNPYAGASKESWSVLASQNVFPISTTTRRGTYNYRYEFSNMGHYNDKTYDKDDLKAIGRIIGGVDKNATGSTVTYSKKPIVNSTTYGAAATMGDGQRWCMYEVYETLCACCGYPIETTTDIFVDKEVPKVKSVTKNNETFSSSKTVKKSTGGTVLYYPSTVSLYDLNNLDDDHTNWSDSLNLLYEGDDYTTSNDKAAQLARAISEYGENIYDDIPEYSYELTPDALHMIQDYNKSKQDLYQIPFSELEAVGGPVYINSASTSKDKENEEPRFVHYKSKFLRGDLSNYETKEYAGKLFTDSGYNYDPGACSIRNQEYNVNTLQSIAKRSGTYGSCLWVDYCGTATSNGKTLNYCLAFK